MAVQLTKVIVAAKIRGDVPIDSNLNVSDNGVMMSSFHIITKTI